MSKKSSVPGSTVTKLSKLVKGGINAVIKELKNDHHIEAENNKNGFFLVGDNNDILELAIEMLERKVDSKRETPRKELGGKGMVKWTFTERESKHIKNLFRAEIQLLIKNYKVTQSNNDGSNKKQNSKTNQASTTVVLACPYESYSKVNDEIERLEKALQDCKKDSVSFLPDDNDTADEFAKMDNDRFYCEKYNSKVTIWGRSDTDCGYGKSKWEEILAQRKTSKSEVVDEPTIPENGNGNGDSEGTHVVSNDVTGINEPAGNDSPVLQVPTMTTSWDDTWDDNNGMHVGATAMVGPIKPEPGKEIGNGKDKKYVFSVNGMVVKVYNTSITGMTGIDAITNAANDRMAHGGGVAYYISKAAGSKMDKECSDYIKKQGKIPVTENFVSNPGNLKNKGIIHAVGPVWSDYQDKTACAEALHRTLWNVLEETKKQHWRTVAIPAISSGIFGVPKQLCAEMYIKAFVDYGYQFGDVVEVHFVDVSQEILDLVIEAHRTWVDDQTSLSFTNALSYDKSKIFKKTQKGGRGNERSPVKPKLQFVNKKFNSNGQPVYMYNVGDKLSLKIYSSDLTALNSVNVIAVPVYNSGRLVDAFKKLYGKPYIKYLDKYFGKQKHFGDVCVFNTSAGFPDLANVMLDSKRIDMESLSNALKTLLRNKFTMSVTLAVPLIGYGLISDRTVTPDLLCEGLIDIIVEVAAENISVNEIHLVNLDQNITFKIQDILKKRTLPATTGNKLYPTLPTAPEYEQQPDTEPNWIKHTPIDTGKQNNSTTDIKQNGKSTITDKAVPTDAQCAFHPEKPGIASLNCNKHFVCKACKPGFADGKCTKCTTTSKNDSTSGDVEHCPICQEIPKQPKKMPCNHVTCNECYVEMMTHKPQCPVCGYIVGILTGNQPPGDMFYAYDKKSLPGFNECGMIIIRYKFPDGKQQKNHPDPGKHYQGIERCAYLPDNKEGKDILRLLRIAFDRKLIFTIGDSRTTGKKGVITWNDIHHKTNPKHGQQDFGYPDPGYLQRVRDELAVKGVTL